MPIWEFMEMVDAVAAATPSDDGTQSTPRKIPCMEVKMAFRASPLYLSKFPSLLVSPKGIRAQLAKNRKTGHILPHAINTPSKVRAFLGVNRMKL